MVPGQAGRGGEHFSHPQGVQVKALSYELLLHSHSASVPNRLRKPGAGTGDTIEQLGVEGIGPVSSAVAITIRVSRLLWMLFCAWAPVARGWVKLGFFVGADDFGLGQADRGGGSATLQHKRADHMCALLHTPTPRSPQTRTFPPQGCEMGMPYSGGQRQF